MSPPVIGDYQVKSFLMLAVMACTIAVPIRAELVGSKDLTSCHLPSYRQEVLCGSHTVFENRAAGEGREIEIHFAVIPAVGETAEPDPVVVFAGGPGQAAMDLAQLVALVFSEVIETRDVILIDQRGMGSSNPLTCEMPEEEFTLGAEEQKKRVREALGECLEELEADVTLYTQDLANEDIHDILVALGVAKANLYGASWGTRSALLYAHQYPEQVRTLVLDGALPLVNTAPLFAATDADRALRALFADCAAEPACDEAFPDLEGDFARAMEVLGDDEVALSVEDPSTGEVQPFTMSRSVFGAMLRGILYVPEFGRVMPLIIHQASEGQYEALLGVSGYLASQTGDSMTLGASLTIFCSEEVARFDPKEVGEQAQLEEQSLVGAALLGELENSCSVWPRAPLPTLYGEDVSSKAPALVLSGDIDPITPPRWGDAISDVLPNSLHLVAPNTGHNVSPVGCAPELIAQFIQSGSLAEIDATCLEKIKRPSFFVSASGPKVN
jgi:pimeloyl-ACP methyl ester carboxylesterase